MGVAGDRVAPENRSCGGFPSLFTQEHFHRRCIMTTAVTTTIKNNILKGLQEIDEISSFKDVERLFLRGQGNSPETYRVYRIKIKLFYDFTKGIHPVLVKPADIEAFYDDRIKKVDRKTAYLDIQALKCCKCQVNFPGFRKINFPVLKLQNTHHLPEGGSDRR
jgi:hypothetical protein